MAENHYIVLGISRGADPSEIRRAYRRLVRQCHPDVERGGSERFHQVQRAYETLRDPELRRRHDAALDVERCPQPSMDSLTPFRNPHDASLVDWQPPFSLFRGMNALFSEADEFLGGWLPGFFDVGRQTSRRKDLHVELILTPEEAASGGRFPLTVPVKVVCMKCGGTGFRGPFVCQACQGGSVEPREIVISVPAGVTDGQSARLSLEDIGLNGVDLNVLVSVR